MDVSSISPLGSYGVTPTYTCDTYAYLGNSFPVASCATTDLQPSFFTTGQRSVSITGTNVAGATQTPASATIQVYGDPNVAAITNQYYSTTIGVNDTLIVWGQGFSWVSNQLQLWSPVYGYRYLNGLYDSYGQISAPLAACCAAGTWYVQAYNNYYPSTWSNSFPITIQ